MPFGRPRAVGLYEYGDTSGSDVCEERCVLGRVARFGVKRSIHHVKCFHESGRRDGLGALSKQPSYLSLCTHVVASDFLTMP